MGDLAFRVFAPVSLGELMTAEQIHAEFYAQLRPCPSVRWVAP